ncbi:MAG: hypothetical protein ABIX01_10500 [Chitinophagaceae bacterium]
MKKILIAVFAFATLVAGTAMAQKAKPKAAIKTTKKTSKVRKAKKIVVGAAKTLNLSLSILKDDATFTYDLKKGDKLVYHVNAYGSEYDFIVSINGFDYDKGIDFNYEMTAPASKTGHVKIGPAGFHSSRKYINQFSGGELNLTDASTIWLCYDAFYDDMPKRQTMMTLDNAAPELFYRPEEDAIEQEIKFKGEAVKVEGFLINNKKDGTGNKEIWVHNSSSNPLILKMDLGWTIELKEVR